MAKRKQAPDPNTPPPALTAQEVRFARHYAEKGIASKAYREAGYDCSNSSDAAVRVRASQLLKRPEVAKLVERMQTEAVDAEQASIIKIAQGLSRVAFADIRKVFSPIGEVLTVDQWPEEIACAGVTLDIRVRCNRDGDIVGTDYKIRMPNPTESLRILAQWRGMIGNKLEDQADASQSQLVIGGEAKPEAL